MICNSWNRKIMNVAKKILSQRMPAAVGYWANTCFFFDVSDLKKTKKCLQQCMCYFWFQKKHDMVSVVIFICGPILGKHLNEIEILFYSCLEVSVGLIWQFFKDVKIMKHQNKNVEWFSISQKIINYHRSYFEFQTSCNFLRDINTQVTQF